MSILKSTNSGAQQKLTIGLLKQLGYEHPFITEPFYFDYDYSKLEKDFIDKQHIETLSIFLERLSFQTKETDTDIKFHTKVYEVKNNKDWSDNYKGCRFATYFYPETLGDLVFLESIFKKYILYGKPIPMTELDGKKFCMVFCVNSEKKQMNSVNNFIQDYSDPISI
jgi:hypothetical protein